MIRRALVWFLTVIRMLMKEKHEKPHFFDRTTVLFRTNVKFLFVRLFRQTRDGYTYFFLFTCTPKKNVHSRLNLRIHNRFPWPWLEPKRNYATLLVSSYRVYKYFIMYWITRRRKNIMLIQKIGLGWNIRYCTIIIIYYTNYFAIRNVDCSFFRIVLFLKCARNGSASENDWEIKFSGALGLCDLYVIGGCRPPFNDGQLCGGISRFRCQNFRLYKHFERH